MLDPQRFFKGQEPDKATLDQVMIRRLKTDIKNDDGTERFPARTINAIDITYTDAEREAHDLLQLYTAARRTKPGAVQARAGDLVTLILKKRLFSSPAAFALTLEAHLESEDQNHQPERVVVAPNAADDLDWMDDVLGWDTEPSDDDPGNDDEREVFGRVASLPGILEDARESGGSVMEAARRGADRAQTLRVLVRLPCFGGLAGGRLRAGRLACGGPPVRRLAVGRFTGRRGTAPAAQRAPGNIAREQHRPPRSARRWSIA